MQYSLTHPQKGIATLATVLLLCAFLSELLVSHSTEYFLLQNSIQDISNQKYSTTLAHTCALIAAHDVLTEELPLVYPSILSIGSTTCSINSISVQGGVIQIQTSSHIGRSESNLTISALLTPASTTPILFEKN